MSDVHGVAFTRGSPETVLPPLAPALAAALATAAESAPEGRRGGFAAIAAQHPRCLEAWASLAELAQDPVARYAYARVGYHRGLDALRAAGWRGSGLVRFEHAENRGFLRALDQLRLAAAQIGESDEEERCRLFLLQLDPGWRSGPGASA